MPSNTAPARGYMIALIASLFLSTTAIFIRHLVDAYALPPLVLAFWREVFVVLTLVIALGWLRRSWLRVERRHLRYLLAYGLLLACFNALWTLSVEANGAAVATVLVYSSAAFTALLGWWLLNEALSGSKLVAVALSFAGCVLIAGALDRDAWDTNLSGIVTGTLAGLSFAIYSLMGRTASQRGLNPWTTLLYTFSFGSVFLLVANLLPGEALPGSAGAAGDLIWADLTLTGWGVLLLLAAIPTLGGYGLVNVSLVYLPSSITQLILTTEPVFTAVIAYLALNERLTATEIAGSALILGGVVVLRLGALRRQARRRRQARNTIAPGPIGD